VGSTGHKEIVANKTTREELRDGQGKV
jgi:hypothetical protein